MNGCVGAGVSDYVIEINENYYIARSNSKTIIFYDKENNIIIDKNIKKIKFNNSCIVFEREFDNKNMNGIEYLIFNYETKKINKFYNLKDLEKNIINLNIKNLSEWISTNNQEIKKYFKNVK